MLGAWLRQRRADLDLAGERAVNRAFVGDLEQALALSVVERPGRISLRSI